MKELDLKIEGKIERLTNETFKFDSRIRDGWYSAVYFLKTTKIVKKFHPNHIVTMQFFARNSGILCGIDEAIALIHTFADNQENLQIQALMDGDEFSPFEPVLKIKGHYQDFGFLEGIIDGILARRSSIATNVYLCCKEAEPAKVIFMGDRDDHYLNQQGDGYSAYIGGVAAQATNAMSEWWGLEGVGTMPHALIQNFGGDLLAASDAYCQVFPEENLIALVDFNNDCITDSLAVARYLKDKLYGVRVDTSKSLIDEYFKGMDLSTFDEDVHGVNTILIKALREALDKEGFLHVKIIVSSGFSVEKIRYFKDRKTPVDTYGIGSSLLKVNIGFTGDCVNLNGEELAKVGRKEFQSTRLKEVKYHNQKDWK